MITILPMLLSCVADGSGGVRYAAVSASQRIMSQLSAQGVKMVLAHLGSRPPLGFKSLAMSAPRPVCGTIIYVLRSKKHTANSVTHA